ncbi:hypothetical protein A3206_08480 [Candidatus Methanomassiliicoccus intestinalis]|nr:MAG: hypothetical protein A3206_08480 [Candidatus Methanomassiliicoccus intestinalis]
MMLAVPLASSSNLFVDGGQTNSNGDAPLIGENADKFDWNSVKGNDLKIIETFIVDSQASYDRLIKYYDFDKSDVGTNSDSWADGHQWIAIVYHVPTELTTGTANVPAITFENANIILNNVKVSNTKTITADSANGKITVQFTNFPENLLNADEGGKECQVLVFELGTIAGSDDCLGLSADKYKGEYTTTVKAGTTVSEPSSVVYTDTEYTVNFNLNADGKSLDDVNVNLPGADAFGRYTWHKDADGNIFAIVSGNITIQELIGAFCSANGSDMKVGHSLDAWTSENGQYDNVKYTSGGDLVKGDMTLSAVWTLDSDNYVEVPVNVYVDGTLTGEYTKTYKFDDKDKVVKFDKKSNVIISPSQIPDMDVNGYVVNVTNNNNKLIYTSEVTDANGNKDPKQISVTGSLEVKFTMNTTLYSKITVSSVMFEEDVVLYALNSSDYKYKDVFDALKDTGNIKVGPVNPDNGSYVTSDKYYKITGWNNGSELPDSTRNASADLTLDAELNSYNVVFMVNGKYEVVKVPYGELSDKLCTLDVSGLNRWVSVDMGKYNGATALTPDTFTTFNFNSSTSVKNVETYAGSLKSDEIAAIFVAVFTTQSSTSYAVFDAGNVSDGGKDADFGNKYVDKIIISGENGKNIPLPGVAPSVDAKAILVDWNRTIGSTKTTYTELSKGVTVSDKKVFNNFEKGSVLTYTASWATYASTITLYSGNDVVGVLYVDNGDVNGNIESLTSDIKAIQYKGTIYNGASKLDTVLTAKKDGYALKQWNDADGTKMISYDPSITGEDKSKFDLTKDFKSIEGDMSLYAKFDANKYTIVYNSAIAAAINEMTQTGYVDDALKLLSEATFNNEGHKLLSWNTRADGLGDSYKLGADFTLTGAQFEDLKDKSGEVSITLYAIWDSAQGSGDNPSGNTDGDNDNSNTDTYLLAGILVVIIILIIVVAVVLRKKN